MALSRTASEPSLRSGSLRTAANTVVGPAPTTSLYASMKEKGLFKEKFPQVPAAGRSVAVPLADSSQQNLQPEIYYPQPETPTAEKRFRRTSQEPGEITRHHGLKEQRLPGDEFRYGVRGVRGVTAEDTMRAGALFGVAEYKNGVAESIYASNKQEPLGRCYLRGHDVRMAPEGFGSKSGIPQECKKVIFPVDQVPDDEAARSLYRRTHNNYQPGERLSRNYSLPAEAMEKSFRFGLREERTADGAGMSMALNSDLDDDGAVRRTRLVQRTAEDYRHVQHPKLFQKTHPKQGAKGPPVPADFAHGIKSTVSEYTAGSCLKGYYALEDQLPDRDLGRCVKPGRRNVTTESRAFGLPSVRTDVAPPPLAQRSVADPVSYGDEPGAAALLAPQTFDDRGVADREFLIRRGKEELRELLEGANLHQHLDFEELWERALELFDDDMPLVSLDALLHLQSGIIEERVGQRTRGLVTASC